MKDQQEFDFIDGGQDGADGAEGASAAEMGHGAFQKLVDYNFLQYASYVICDRAIPNVKDGLKPVQRRILHALYEKDDGRFIKVANVVGHTMQYHPHGDASITDALVNLANKRYLIEGQGNFGNIFTGDSAAAPRYIECRLTPLAREELFNKDLTEFVPSYDGRNNEPVAFPPKLPVLLMLGAEGIAVGLSTRILPHNFRELLEAQIAIIKKKRFEIFPDFIQGGSMDVSEYDRGHGKVRVRAAIRERAKNRLVVSEIPYGVTTESLIASIEDAVKKHKVPVKSISDYTSEKVEIELALKPGVSPEKAMDTLYAFTSCEVSISSRLIVLRDNRPVEMNVEEVLVENTNDLVDTLKRELALKKHNLLEELHAKTLVQIFVENRIYKHIEKCKTAAAVQKAILDGFEPFRKELRRDITRADVEMLLGVRIRRISLFDINKNRKEIDDILLELKKVEKNLGSLKTYAVNYLSGLLKKYGDMYPRSTRVTGFDEIEVRELTSKELEICHDKESGYFGYDIKGEQVMHCSSLDKLIYVLSDAKYRVVPPPDKLFAGENLLYLAKYDRDRVMTVVYTHDQFTYMKRFTFGGVIMNKDYLCAPEDSKILLFSDEKVEEVYVKYAPAKGQRIHQQRFSPESVAVKGVRAAGNRMTGKKIARLSTTMPRWWKKGEDGPSGVLL